MAVDGQILSRFFELTREASDRNRKQSLTPERLREMIVEAHQILGEDPDTATWMEALYNEIRPEWREEFRDILGESEEDEGSAVIDEMGGNEGEFVQDAPVAKAEDTDYENEVQVQPEQLPPHDIDIPEEPELVNVVARVWNSETQTFEEKDLGEMLLVPTGCDCSEYVSPYKTDVKFKSALPRDLEKDVNLYAAMQTNGWISRRWAQEHLELGINPAEADKEIADDIPFILSMKGVPDPTQQVAQTEGLSPGSNNGAPLPPGPGPGRGNKFAPGDGMAGKPPPNGAPGSSV